MVRNGQKSEGDNSCHKSEILPLKGGSHRQVTVQNVATPFRGGARGRNGEGRRGEGGARSNVQSCHLEDLLRKKGIDDAWTALEDMQRQGVLTDKYTVSRMLMKTVGDGRLRTNTTRVYRSISIVEKFIDMQPKDVDEVLFNALLDTCCRLKDLARLESIVQRMRNLKVTPSPVTLGILVKTYGQVGDLPKVLQVWDEMEKQRDQANAVTYGCMIDACVKCGNLAKAVEIFTGMRKDGKHRNTILYTILIKGYGLEKDVKSALELFREMPGEGVPYNTITYNSIIDACVKAQDLKTAEQLLTEMTLNESMLEPDLITFSTILKGYCYIGNLDKALQVAETIKGRGLRCDELVYNTLMDGCVKANDVLAGVGLFEEMIAAGMRPSSITHGVLTRLYQRTGSEEDAAEAAAQLYQLHGIDRPTDRTRNSTARGKWDARWSPATGARVEHYHAQSPARSPCSERYTTTSATATPLAGHTNRTADESYWFGDLAMGHEVMSSEPSTPAGNYHAVRNQTVQQLPNQEMSTFNDGRFPHGVCMAFGYAPMMQGTVRMDQVQTGLMAATSTSPPGQCSSSMAPTSRMPNHVPHHLNLQMQPPAHPSQHQMPMPSQIPQQLPLEQQHMVTQQMTTQQAHHQSQLPMFGFPSNTNGNPYSLQAPYATMATSNCLAGQVGSMMAMPIPTGSGGNGSMPIDFTMFTNGGSGVQPGHQVQLANTAVPESNLCTEAYFDSWMSTTASTSNGGSSQ